MYDFKAINLFSDDAVPRLAICFPHKPWVDYDPSCEARVKGAARGLGDGDPESVAGGFFPMLPTNGPKSLKLTRIETDLAEADRSLAEGKLTPRNEHLRILSKYTYQSWIAQLRGDPGAIPEEAGAEYRQWIDWLRAHDPSLGGDSHYETTVEDRRRTEEAVDRSQAASAVKAKERRRQLEASGKWKGYYAGKENDPSRLPR